MLNRIPLQDGIFPTMMIAYKEDGSIDFDAMERILNWYIENGVHGIFALCHSTESHWLTEEEKVTLARFVMKTVNGRVPVVSSGVTAEDLTGQLEQAKRIADTGADAVVFIRNRLGETEADFKRSLDRIVNELPDLPLGLYECPYPYKQYITDTEFALAVQSGRFRFLKDTVCDVDVMRRRAAIRDQYDPAFRLYNANCATFLTTLRFGYNGFSGIMANFHPDLYSWVFENRDDPRADLIDPYLGVTSVIEMRCYPICAKRYLNKYENLPMTEICRSVKDATVPALAYELDGVYQLTKLCREMIKEK